MVHTVNIAPWSVNIILVLLHEYLRYLHVGIFQLSGMHSISTYKEQAGISD
jgi:hypothetical protein